MAQHTNEQVDLDNLQIDPESRASSPNSTARLLSDGQAALDGKQSDTSDKYRNTQKPGPMILPSTFGGSHMVIRTGSNLSLHSARSRSLANLSDADLDQKLADEQKAILEAKQKRREAEEKLLAGMNLEEQITYFTREAATLQSVDDGLGDRARTPDTERQTRRVEVTSRLKQLQNQKIELEKQQAAARSASAPGVTTFFHNTTATATTTTTATATVSNQAPNNPLPQPYQGCCIPDCQKSCPSIVADCWTGMVRSIRNALC